MTRLGDIFESQIAGEWGSECVENENGTKVLRTTNFTQEGKINYGDVVIRSINQSKVEKKRLHYGDIILEKSGGTEKTPVGRVVFCDEAIEDSIYLCNNFTQAMRVNQAIAIPRYVFYFMWYLHSSGKTDLLQNKTTGIRNLQVKSYLNENCPLPALEEQRKIAAVLDKVSNLIAKRRQQLDKLDELVKSRFVEMFGDSEKNPFGWPQTPLANLITNANNGMARRGNDAEGNIVMRLVELQDGYIDYSSPNRIILNDAEKRRYLLRDKDFLFARVNGNPENVGRCAVFCDMGEPVYHNDHIIRVHFNEALIDGAFASALFNSAYGKRQMSSQIKTSAGQYTISQDGIGAIITILPPLPLQQQFAAFVAQTDKSKLVIQKSLEKLEMLKRALMQKYFE